MSYTVSFFLTDIEKIRGVIGGKDLSIMDKLDVDDENRRYIKMLILGNEPEQDDDPSEYGYAFEKIVKYFSDREGVSEFEDLRFSEFDDPPLDWILESGSPIELPLNDNFPYIGHRTVADMQKTLDEWNDDQFDNFDPELQEMIEALLCVFQKATEQKKDLITFYY
jgi:hypothetical protein